MEQIEELQQSKEILNLFESLQVINTNTIVNEIVDTKFPINGELRNNEMCFYRVNQLSFDEDYPHHEAFENVLLSMDNEAFNFVYILTGTETGIELHIGVVQNQNENLPVLGKKLSASNYGEIVASVFEGNFNGSKLEKLRGEKLKEVVSLSTQKYKNAGVIVGIPSINEKDTNSEYDFQGIDRLINTMLGLEWRLVIVCEPVSKFEILKMKEDVYELYNRLSVCSKRTMQHSVNDGQTISFGKSVSEAEGKNWGYNKSTSKTKGNQSESGKSSGTSSQEGNSEGTSYNSTKGSNTGASINRGSSTSVTVEIANKHAMEIMKYMDEELLERLKVGFSKGLFKSSVYYMAKEPAHANRLKVGIMSLFQGNKSTYSPLYAQKIDLEKDLNFSMLRTYQNQYIEAGSYSSDALMLLGRPFYGSHVGLNTYLTTEEVSLLAGLPQNEVPGLSLKEGVSFGLNEKKTLDENTAINLGVMVQKGRRLDKIPFVLSKDSLAKHTFIAGVTGSGKTTTCHKLLSEAKMPFLVIEPAKTEYRTLMRSYEDIVVFTLGNEMVAPFRINPFELMEGEIISAHVDMIKATFTSAFPMEASMPQILEEAIYKCYEKTGWNINTNVRNDKENQKERIFPIMSDLLEELKAVVKSKNFGSQMEGDYIGSLVSRLSNLTVGSKGSMLNCETSTDFNYIATHNVIIEMEELKSPEDKALFMGFILSRLAVVIKNKHRKNPEYKHLTLIEEAHRLLAKIEYGDSGAKKSAVETFTDLLAEVRKYGEGLIIVDQIPNKLASEVLKNTNTKIIHKILARDDKETVGDTMLMDDKQKEYLSALEVGNAIVFSEQTDKPVHIYIKSVSDTSERQIEDEEVKERFDLHKENLGICYEKPEIIKLYPEFVKLAKLILQRKVEGENKEFCKNFKQKVENISEILKMSKEEIWETLIKINEKLSGKQSASLENYTERVRELTRFFLQFFNSDDFSKDDIKTIICRYLM